MTLRYKLLLSLGLHYSFFLFLTAGLVWYGGQVKEVKGVHPWIILLGMVCLFGLGILYILIFSLTERLQALVFQVEEMVFNRSVQTLGITGFDEVGKLGRSVEALRQQQIQGEKEQSRLVADVAHELRTPLTIFRSELETLQNQSEELRQEQLLPLLDEILRMTRLVQDLQQLSMAETGRLTLKKEWIPVSSLVENIFPILIVEAAASEIQLINRLDVKEDIYVDKERIKQVLINLLGNALRYTPPGGCVEITGEGKNDRIRIYIQDDGPGIPPEHLPYLFQRFYRVDGSRNRETGGTGLGLAIAKELVEAHEGQLTVNSHLGKGTVFIIELPVFPLS